MFSSFFHIAVNENIQAEQSLRKCSLELKKISDHNKATGASKDDALTLSDDEGNSMVRKRNPTDHFTPEDENKKPAATRPKKTSTPKAPQSSKRKAKSDVEKPPFSFKRPKSTKVPKPNTAQKKLKVVKTPSKKSKAIPSTKTKTSKHPQTPTKTVAQRPREQVAPRPREQVAQRPPELEVDSDESESRTSFPPSSRMHKDNLPDGMIINKVCNVCEVARKKCIKRYNKDGSAARRCQRCCDLKFEAKGCL